MTALHVSVSQIKQYLRCPRSYELKYVRGTDAAFVPIPLAFGGAFHAALAFFYGLMKEAGAPPSLEETTQVFLDAWRNASDGPLPIQAEDDEDAIDHEARGQAMLAAFHAHVAATPVVVEAVEPAFSVELHDPDTGEVLEERLVGAFDLLLREDQRRLVVEHKTSARRYSNDQLRFDLQATAYWLAAAKIGLGEVGIRYQVVTKTKTPIAQVVDLVRGPRDEDDLLRTVVGVLRAIDAHVFYPLRGYQCRTCPFAYACNRV